jgi:hypothetical protein
MVEVSYSYHHTTREGRAEFLYELIGTAGVIRYDRERRSLPPLPHRRSRGGASAQRSAMSSSSRVRESPLTLVDHDEAAQGLEGGTCLRHPGELGRVLEVRAGGSGRLKPSIR